MADNSNRKKPGTGRPEIWASGGQRPPFDIRALGRACLHLSREGIAPLHAWAARGLRRAAINVRNGAGRIPAEKLGRAERFVPSHLRVSGWIKNSAAVLSHASATADPDVARGNALVAEIAPHLWGAATASPDPALSTGPDLPPDTILQSDTLVPPGPPDSPATVAPVVLTEPQAADDDPLRSIRGDLSDPQSKGVAPGASRKTAAAPQIATPPAPPGPVAEGAIQVSGYLVGWATVVAALPYGLLRALWLWVNGRDLKTISTRE